MWKGAVAWGFNSKNKNKTYLPIDVLLYPAEPIKTAHTDSDKKHKKNIKYDPTLNHIIGLKGYPSAGNKVFEVMNQVQNENLQN